jgi:hypothetical protein
MSDCVVFYSRSGNTRFVADEIARRKGAETVRLEEQKPRKGVLGFIRSGYQAKTRKASLLKGEPWDRIGNCETMYLLTPIWAGNGTPAVNAFLDRADLSGKKVILVTLQADAAGAGSADVHRYLTGRIGAAGGEVAGTHALHSAVPGKFAGEEQLLSEAEKIFG